MMKLSGKIFLLLIVFPSVCSGQETDAGPGFQMLLINNPAFSGSEGEGVLRLSYLNYYPGNNYNLHSVYFSYDSYFPLLHGGVGVFLSDDYQGDIVNDLRGGMSYSYFLQAGKNLFINAGLSGSVYHRGYNFDKAVFPDQIDPLGGVYGPTAELPAASGRTVLDIGAGFLLMTKGFFGGLAINHLAEPDLSTDGSDPEKLKRKLLVQLAGDLVLSKNMNLNIRPLLFFNAQGGFLSGATGAVFESKYLSINILALGNNNGNLNLQSGFSVKAGKITLFYNYRLNILSGNNMFPVSLLHQTGLALSLYNVDKRNVIKTINFPKM